RLSTIRASAQAGPPRTCASNNAAISSPTLSGLRAAPVDRPDRPPPREPFVVTRERRPSPPSVAGSAVWRLRVDNPGMDSSSDRQRRFRFRALVWDPPDEQDRRFGDLADNGHVEATTAREALAKITFDE